MSEEKSKKNRDANVNLEVEQYFLGCVLSDGKYWDEISYIRAEMLSSESHQRIYDVVRETYESGGTPIIAALAKQFDDDAGLSEAGGGQYLRDLIEIVPTTLAVKDYAAEIYSLYLKRTVIDGFNRVIYLAEDTRRALTGADVLAQAESVMESIVIDKGADQGVVAPKQGVERALEAMGRAQRGERGLNTGIEQLDDIIKGLAPGNLYIIAGRPAMGKTAFGLTVAANMAWANKSVLFYSLEMPVEQLYQRILSRVSRVPMERMQTEKMLTQEDMEAIIKAGGEIGRWPLHIDDGAGLTMADIASRSKRHKRKYGVDVIMVDYLGLVNSQDKKASKVHQIEEITVGLKQLAKRIGVPVVLFAQLNRAVEFRDNKRPMLADLRDSGSIEQDADAVMFLFREEYYLQQPEMDGEREAERLSRLVQCQGLAEIIVAKNRHGRFGTAWARFDGGIQEFGSVDKGFAAI